MKTLLEILRERLVIGALIFAFCFVTAVYIISETYYSRFVPEPLPLTISEPTVTVYTSNPIKDPSVSETPVTQPDQVSLTSSDQGEITSDIDSYELTPEDEALLLEHFAETAPPAPRESIFGLGPYPEVPSDYPNQSIWEDLENLYETGHATVEHELIHRVLIKLWNQGQKVDGSFMSSKNGRVYPLYNDTVYVRYSEDENEDGSIERYVSSFTAHSSLQSYEEDVREGAHPSWIKVIHYEDGGIEPYSFLDLD